MLYGLEPIILVLSMLTKNSSINTISGRSLRFPRYASCSMIHAHWNSNLILVLFIYWYARLFNAFLSDQMSFCILMDIEDLNNWKVIDVVFQIYFVMSILKSWVRSRRLPIWKFEILTKSITSFFAWGWNLKRMISPIWCFLKLSWITSDPTQISASSPEW